MRVSTFASGIGFGLAGRFLGRFVAVLTGIIAARVLGPSIFGLYAIGLALIRLGEVVVPLGFDVGVIKYGAEYSGDKLKLKGMLYYSFGITFGFGLLIGLLCFLFSDYIARVMFNQPALGIVFRYFSLTIPFLAILSIAAPATRISQDLKYSFLAQDFGQPLLAFVLFITFTFFGWGLQGALLSELLSFFLSAMTVLLFLRWLYPFVFDLKGKLYPPAPVYYEFSITSSFSLVFVTLILWIDRMILGIYFQPAVVGVYQSAAQLSVVFALILGGMNKIITPMYAALHSGGHFSEVGNLYKVGTKWAVYLGLPVLLVILFRAHELIAGIYGEPYLNGIPVLYVLLAGQFINLYTGSVAPLLNVSGYQSKLLLFSAIALVISITLNFFLIPIYGEVGAAISTSFSIIFYYISLLFFAGIRLKTWPIDGRHFKIVAAFIICSIYFLFIDALGIYIPLHWIPLELLFTYTLFASVIFIAGLDAEDREFLAHARLMVRSRLK